MAKITITFEDKTQDGVEGVSMTVDCDPPVDPNAESVECTAAMRCGVAISHLWQTGELKDLVEKTFLKVASSD